MSVSGKPPGAWDGCGAIFDPPRLTADLEALEERMRAGDFWDDQAAARAGGGGVAVQQRHVEQKVGRNDPCWCGSGKKYKKCHGA